MARHAFQVAAFTHGGLVRAENQDALVIGPSAIRGDLEQVITLDIARDQMLLAVLDGFGGYAIGAAASHAVSDFLARCPSKLSVSGSLEALARAANDLIYALTAQDQRLAGMGTTIAMASLTNETLTVLNVGDSRVYRFADDELTALSRDDVVLRAGPDGCLRKMITAALGGQANPTPIFPHVLTRRTLKPGERLLLVSDGVTDVVTDAEIENTMLNAYDPLDALERIVALTFQAGAPDNLSAMICEGI